MQQFPTYWVLEILKYTVLGNLHRDPISKRLSVRTFIISLDDLGELNINLLNGSRFGFCCYIVSVTKKANKNGTLLFPSNATPNMSAGELLHLVYRFAFYTLFIPIVLIPWSVFIADNLLAENFRSEQIKIQTKMFDTLLKMLKIL